MFSIYLISFVLSVLLLGIHSIPVNYDNEPLFEGDIAGVKLISNMNNSKGLAQLETNSRGRWPNGVVPYVIDDLVYTATQLKTIREGMNLLETQTRNCVKFVPRTTESTWIRIISGSGCWSFIGRQKKSGEQQVSLQNPSCIYKGLVAHELTHALGFWHEQSRSDRDNFVTINWQNIATNQEHNFNKYGANLADTLGFPYDYSSIMHYGPKEFSKNGLNTIEPKQSGVVLLQSYQRNAISVTDVEEIRKYYGCV